LLANTDEVVCVNVAFESSNFKANEYEQIKI